MRINLIHIAPLLAAGAAAVAISAAPTAAAAPIPARKYLHPERLGKPVRIGRQCRDQQHPDHPFHASIPNVGGRLAVSSRPSHVARCALRSAIRCEATRSPTQDCTNEHGPAGKITGVANKVSSIPLPLLQA